MTEKKIYRITPKLCQRIWGGDGLAPFGKCGGNCPGDRIGESWELSFVSGSEATVDGLPLSRAIPRSEWGECAARFERFPVLTKFIDARESLSVQVHPSDEYAREQEGDWGKCEMWYVVSAESGAGVYLGPSREVTREELRLRAESGSLEEILRFVPVASGDVIYIPAGTIHSICGGVLVYEIQESSDITYRLYDYMRRDGEGRLRELHIDRALDVACLKPYEAPPRVKLSEDIMAVCDYFEARKCKLNFTKAVYFVDKSSFVAVTCVEGSASLDGEPVSIGDTLFVPAGYGEFTLEGCGTLLLVSVPEISE